MAVPRRVLWVLCLIAALWPAGARAGPLGLNLDPAKLQPSAVPALFSLARATGAGSVRIPFDWSAIDPAPGAHLFARYDEIVADAARAGFDIVGVLGPSVAWASPGDPQHFAAPWQRSIYLPGSLGDWSEYVGSVVARYRDRVHAWEIWEEPDSYEHFRTVAGRARAAAYFELLQSAYAAIKEADPDAVVLLGGLAVWGDTEPGFVPQLLALGAGDAFDVFGVHAAGAPRAAAEAVRQAVAWQDAVGLAKPVWLTSVGVATGTGAGPAGGAPVGGTTGGGPGETAAEDGASAVIEAVAVALAAGAERVYWRAGEIVSPAAYVEQGAGSAQATGGQAAGGRAAGAAAAYAFGLAQELFDGVRAPVPLNWVAISGNPQVYAFATPRGRLLVAWAEGAGSGATPAARIGVDWEGRRMTLSLGPEPLLLLESPAG